MHSLSYTITDKNRETVRICIFIYCFLFYSINFEIPFFPILASYLPKPSSQEYEFVYVDAQGEVCSRSPKFTFCAPKPLEDLVTLEEESYGEEEGTDMLLVVPRAELLQVSINT